MLSLPAHRPLPVAYAPELPEPTHVVQVWCMRKADIGDLIGVLQHWDYLPASNRRLQRLEALVRHRCAGRRIHLWLVPTEGLREQQRLSDLERFRRKMMRVLRAYDEDRAAILSGATGLFQDERLRELDALLEQAWQKMEQRYRCRREDLQDEGLRARAEELRKAGALKESDYYETAGA